MSLEKKPASSPQIAQIGLLVAQQVIAKIEQKQLQENPLSFDEAQTILTPPYNDKLKKLVVGVADAVLEIRASIKIPTIHQRQIDKLTKYWKDKWNHNIPWDTLVIPEQPKGLNVLEYEPSIFTEDEKLAKYKENHGEDSVWCCYHNQDLKVKDSIKLQANRPAGPYLYWHVGGQESDRKHLNKSYVLFDAECHEEGINFAIPTEGITMADRYRVETNKMMDVKGLTIFHALDHYGYAMFMCRRDDGWFYIYGDYRVHRDSDHGPREVSF